MTGGRAGPPKALRRSLRGRRESILPSFAIIDFPSNLGLRPSGVEELPDALRRAGLPALLHARHAATVLPTAAYDPTRVDGILNGPAIRDTARLLARAVADVIAQDEIPIVLAGDCSVILGALAGAKSGLLFIDGHVDFYQPGASPTGEVADMDLAMAIGEGLVREEDVVAVGARDADERDRAGSQDIRKTRITLFELPDIRTRGIEAIANDALRVLAGDFWCHIDADVLDDAAMPAVDYRQPGGLTPSELTALLKKAFATRRMVGLSVAIYNPRLDPDGSAARVLVETIVEGLT